MIGTDSCSNNVPIYWIRNRAASCLSDGCSADDGLRIVFAASRKLHVLGESHSPQTTIGWWQPRSYSIHRRNISRPRMKYDLASWIIFESICACRSSTSRAHSPASTIHKRLGSERPGRAQQILYLLASLIMTPGEGQSEDAASRLQSKNRRRRPQPTRRTDEQEPLGRSDFHHLGASTICNCYHNCMITSISRKAKPLETQFKLNKIKSSWSIIIKIF